MRHLRSLFDLPDSDTVMSILHRAQALKRERRRRRLPPTLSGRVVALLFERASTRTRLSFEAGIHLLGGSPVTVQARDTQLVAGELLRDAARTFGSYADVLVLRTFAQQTVDEVARHAGIPVINGLSDLDHPCQVLADLFTVFERRPEPFQLRWAFVGDTPHMVNGYVAASALLGFELRLGLPSGTDVEAATWARAERLGARVQCFRSPLEAAQGAHVVSTGPWPATFTTHPEASVFQVNATMLAGTAEAFVLHRLPAQRGVEITDDVLEGRHSLAFEAAANRLPVQQALLEWLLDVPVF